MWAACSKYAPFETCSQEFPVCSLEFAELKGTTKGEFVYDAGKRIIRLCFYRNGDVWTIEMAPESSLPIVAVMEASLGFEKARIKMLETAPKTFLFALDNVAHASFSPCLQPRLIPWRYTLLSLCVMVRDMPFLAKRYGKEHSQPSLERVYSGERAAQRR